MPAHKVVTDGQLALLLEAMEREPDIANGRVASRNAPLAKQTTKLFWESLALDLNSLGSGATKTGMKWKEYWSEKKYACKRKAAGIRAHGQGTGGGPPTKGKLTDIEEKILSIMGKVTVFGEPSVAIPFDENLPSISEDVALGEEEDTEESPAPPAESVEPVADDQPSTSSAAQVLPQPGHQPSTSSSRPRMAERISVPPPHWAVDIENRRLEAELQKMAVLERIAKALEVIAAKISGPND